MFMQIAFLDGMPFSCIYRHVQARRAFEQGAFPVSLFVLRGVSSQHNHFVDMQDGFDRIPLIRVEEALPSQNRALDIEVVVTAKMICSYFSL